MIPLLLEPNSGENCWAQACLLGVRDEARRRGLSLLPKESEEPVPSLVVGSTIPWLHACLSHLQSRGLAPVVVGVPPQGWLCSFISPDYEQAVSHFICHTKGKRALFGVHAASAADQIKNAAFQRLCPEERVYRNYGSLLESAKAFAAQADQFDSVLCANDMAAVILRRLLPCGGPALYAFGDQQLPPEEKIQIYRMPLEEMGRQAVALYRWQEKDTSARHCVYLRCAPEAASGEVSPAVPAPVISADFYQDPDVAELFRFKTLLYAMDSLDLDIVRSLLAGQRYFDMTESLHTTENTIKYRVKRMMHNAGAATREELLLFTKRFLLP
ncbi:MAG: hypothetical protein PHI98_14545 [Eubacteriales bacterium]|nr:hypothetical protein [Eubacteriales bacterium]